VRSDTNRGIPFRFKCVLVIAGLIIAGTTKYFVDVRQKTRMRDIGYRINQYRQQVIEAENIRANLCFVQVETRRPEVVICGLRAFGITLVRPPLEHVIHLPMPAQVDGLPNEQAGAEAESPDKHLARVP